MELSILTSTKKILGIDSAYTAFDLDIITHINSALATLSQLGVGPEGGVMIEDDSVEWSAIIDADLQLNHVQSYVYLVVRSMFDPPATGFATDAMKNQIKELEWRISATREERLV
jgi:hypothetical protein